LEKTETKEEEKEEAKNIQERIKGEL